MNPDSVHTFFSFLYEGWVGDVVSWLRLIAGIASSAFFAGIIVIAFKFRQVSKPKIRMPEVVIPNAPSTALVRGPWQDVTKKIQSSYPSDWNFAVIQADSIFDSVLKDMGLLGTTLGDRLKQLDFAKLHSLNDVWEAHKIRNRIAHETDRVLTQQQAERAVSLFAKALKELEYLEEE